MKKIEILVNEDTVLEAEKVLQSMGMDVDIAVEVFLRRVIVEKRLPMIMSANAEKASQDNISDTRGEKTLDDLFENSSATTRSTTKITTEMVDEIWHAFRRHVEGNHGIKDLSIEVSGKTGMNQGSAIIYLTVLSNLYNGEPNKRLIKFQDFEYLMEKFREELGDNRFQKAIQSLRNSIPYWKEKIPGAFAEKVETYCNENS